MNDMMKSVKFNILKELKKLATDQMGDSMAPELKKSKEMGVTVAAKDPEALKMGLDKAKDLVAGNPHTEHMEEVLGEDLDHDNESGESPSHKQLMHEEHQEDMDMSPEDIDAKIEHLMQMKKMHMKSPKGMV